METDMRQKRANFISRSLEIREQFSFAHPMEVLMIVVVYCCDHYGSMTWDLSGTMAAQYFSSSWHGECPGPHTPTSCTTCHVN